MILIRYPEMKLREYLKSTLKHLNIKRGKCIVLTGIHGRNRYDFGTQITIFFLTNNLISILLYSTKISFGFSIRQGVSDSLVPLVKKVKSSSTIYWGGDLFWGRISTVAKISKSLSLILRNNVQLKDFQ